MPFCVMERKAELMHRNSNTLFLNNSGKARNTSLPDNCFESALALAFFFGSAVILPRYQSIATAITTPGTILMMTTSRHVSASQAIRPPAASGASASPTLPPMP